MRLAQLAVAARKLVQLVRVLRLNLLRLLRALLLLLRLVLVSILRVNPAGAPATQSLVLAQSALCCSGRALALAVLHLRLLHLLRSLALGLALLLRLILAVHAPLRLVTGVLVDVLGWGAALTPQYKVLLNHLSVVQTVVLGNLAQKLVQGVVDLGLDRSRQEPSVSHLSFLGCLAFRLPFLLPLDSET